MQSLPVRSYVSEDNTLIIIVDDVRFYEFRDLTPRDVLWIDHQFESDHEVLEKEKFKESLSFLTNLVQRIIINTNADIMKEDWFVFMEINTMVQENIMATRLGWYDFLGFVFAAGNKSFAAIQNYMDLPLSNIVDMYDVLLDYFEQQKAMMDDAEGRVR